MQKLNLRMQPNYVYPVNELPKKCMLKSALCDVTKGHRYLSKVWLKKGICLLSEASLWPLVFCPVLNAGGLKQRANTAFSGEF